MNGFCAGRVTRRKPGSRPGGAGAALAPGLLALALVCWPLAPGRAADRGKPWDYTRLPLANELFAVSWGASGGLSPAVMFWFKGRHFSDPAAMGEARRSAASIRQAGKTPMAGFQRWEDTFVQSLPRSRFPGAPSWVDGRYAEVPEFTAWAKWVEGRPHYLDTARDGGSFPPWYREWGGMHGNVSPLMPLDPGDIPAGMAGGTYGDLVALRWAEAAARRAGASGIGLSDFTDSLPTASVNEHDFNPRLIGLFEKAAGLSVPGGTVPERADYILSRHFNQWTDFWCEGWATFFASLVRQVGAATGKEPLLIEQVAFGPALLRTRALDPRIVQRRIGATSILYVIDAMTMSPERRGSAMTETTRINGTFAAYEPDARFGANLSSDDDLFWRGVDVHWAGLAPAERRARGSGSLKRLWLENGWLHVASTLR